MSVKKRFAQLGLATGALVVAAGWWVALVELWPASSRPYIGGSQNNSFLELTFGYNGFGRLSGDETGSVGGGGGGTGTGMWGATGWNRMFNDEIGSQISWLLPAALILLVASLVATRKLGRTSVRRSSMLVWGGSLVTTLVVFSYMAGIFHQYYTIALAPTSPPSSASARVPSGRSAARSGRRSPSRRRQSRPGCGATSSSTAPPTTCPG